MAHYMDFDGVYFTLQSLRMHHREAMSQVELIVVDNSPHHQNSEHLKQFMDSCRPFTAGSRYVPMPDGKGTTQPRERVFAEATGKAVMCVDCHVLFEPGSVQRLLDYYDANPDTKNLFSGPLVMDSLASVSTHFNNVWRGEMWGIWGAAWGCKCGLEGDVFTLFEVNKKTDYRCMDHDASPYTGCSKCGEMPPVLGIVAGYERQLDALGFWRAGQDPEHPPFEIPAQGLGVFSCRKDAWLGFNPLFRGFGGEEFYIHHKYRLAGHKCISLPFLRWCHRFARPSGVPYAPTLYDKVQNYMIGHEELGLPLDDLHQHFVNDGPLEEPAWEMLLKKDPTERSGERKHTGGCKNCNEEVNGLDLDGLYEFYKNKPSDFNEHFAKIREFAAKCDHVTELGSRDYGVIPLAAGCRKTVRSYNSATDGSAFWRLEAVTKEVDGLDVVIRHDPANQVVLEETDLLFVDNAEHNAAAVGGLFRLHIDKVRRFIIVHDTELFGAKGDNGGPGLKVALMSLMATRPEWTVIYNTPDQYGLMVLSRNPEDKPKRPNVFTMGANYLKHTAEHIATGMEDVDQEWLAARLEECWLCDLRTGSEQCSLCGCPLVSKAKRAASRCDANKWVQIDERMNAREPAAEEVDA